MNEDIKTIFQTYVDTHKQMLSDINGTHNTVIINAFAGPGAGKTVSAWEIAAKLNRLGYETELVTAYAKELVWNGRSEMLDGSIENQLEILQEQVHRIDLLVGKVDFIITDAPLLQNAQYLREYDEDYELLTLSLFKQYRNFSYIVEERSKQQRDQEQGVDMDSQIVETLKRLNIYAGRYTNNTIEKTVSNIVKYANGRSVKVSDNSEKAEPLPLSTHPTKEPTEMQRLNKMAMEIGVAAFDSVDNLERLLTVLGRFEYYSVNNILLITAQRPTASVLKSYDDWQKVGYSIGKGQKSLSIIKRDDSKGTYFTSRLFDITQTDADPTAFVAFKLSSQLLIKALLSTVEKGTIIVNTEKCNGECAFFSPVDNTVYVQRDLPSTVLINSLVRELILYDIASHKKYDRKTFIGEATAVSYSLCSKYNIDTGYLDLDYCLSDDSLEYKQAKQKLESIKGHTRNYSIRIDRFIEKVQKREITRG